MKANFLLYIFIFLVIISTILFFEGILNRHNKKLLKVFPTDVETKAIYNGYAEYGHTIIFSKTEGLKNKSKLFKYYVDGVVHDAKGDSYNRKFNIKYVIDKNSIKEIVVNNDEFREKGVNNKLNSIIPNQIILKLPLKVGNSWEQKFTYNNKEYVANTVITFANRSNKNKKLYKTRTVVDKIEGFFNDRYIEERLYEENRGLISFTNSMPLFDIDIDRELEEEDYMFGYYQTYIIYPN